MHTSFRGLPHNRQLKFMVERLRLRIGGVGVCFETQPRSPGINLHSRFAPFRSHLPADIRLKFSRQRYHVPPQAVVCFSSLPEWTLSHWDNGWILQFNTPVAPRNPHQVAVFNHSFNQGEVFQPPQTGSSAFWVDSNLLQTALMYQLCANQGLLVHGCGVISKGKGLAFLGRPGEGKSTLARLFSKQDQVTVASDERIVLRWEQGRYWIYGTPWISDAGCSSPAYAPLEQVYILSHAVDNRVQDYNHLSQAAVDLFQRTFLPPWDAENLSAGLATIDSLVSSVPVQKLGFVPDPSVVSFLRQRHGL